MVELLLSEIRKCTVCLPFLTEGCRPVVQASAKSRILIIGQAPGKIVHQSGIPWNDKSGDNLRKWLGVTPEQFYDPDIFAFMPMGFCYPGKGTTGDLSPRPECAPLWHARLLEKIENIRLTLLIGQYAQQFYLGTNAAANLTQTVKQYFDYAPDFIPLPHPSPRNNIWQAKHQWFSTELIPYLQQKIQSILTQGS